MEIKTPIRLHVDTTSELAGGGRKHLQVEHMWLQATQVKLKIVRTTNVRTTTQQTYSPKQLTQPVLKRLRPHINFTVFNKLCELSGDGMLASSVGRPSPWIEGGAAALNHVGGIETTQRNTQSNLPKTTGRRVWASQNAYTPRQLEAVLIRHWFDNVEARTGFLITPTGDLHGNGVSRS